MPGKGAAHRFNLKSIPAQIPYEFLEVVAMVKIIVILNENLVYLS